MLLQDFLADDQLDKTQLLELISLAIDIKSNPANYSQALAGKSVVMIFEKPSLRTHVSFDIGINKLGGHSLYLGQHNGKLGERERIKDVAKNIERWADVIVARVFEHSALEELADNANIPVINALCNTYHPCQSLADFVTLAQTFPDVTKLNLAYVGDSNNVANSLMLMSAILGTNFTLACPQGKAPNEEQLTRAYELAKISGSKISVIHDISQLGEQDAIYTDTWISMGDTSKMADVRVQFAPFQVNHALMAQTGAKTVMHCQPAHLGEEISEALFDSEMSLAFEQAENRMWAQNAVLVSFFAQ